MGTNAAGFTPNVARQVAQVNQKANADRNIQANTNQGPSAAASTSATAPTNTPAVTTAVAASGSAPAAPVGGTTAPTSPAAAARAAAPTQASSMPIAGHPGAMAAMMMNSGIASQAITVSGVGESKDKNKDETNKAINRATDVGDKSALALQGENSSVKEDAAKGVGSGTSGPGATTA